MKSKGAGFRAGWAKHPDDRGRDCRPTTQTILQRASSLYRKQHLRRVYYSAFSPIPDASSNLPLIAPPLVREHRLYQADWLMRFYGFDVAELTTREEPNLPLNLDPKLAWALRNREKFPIDLNKAPREMLLRVPGLGVRNVDRIIRIRRWHSIRLDDLSPAARPAEQGHAVHHCRRPHAAPARATKRCSTDLCETQEQTELFQIAA